ncbi:hypothetical protein CONLIGDRAFT_712357 [Coniochaeta ligniaria NRRL 30616]|uniref:Uncharacterized protein n=1 Tax=Coniochaeta ligniaria NRRL 30616 TaxID=1408157 RepID=A0A1J7JVY2_9PEZI|nr:hypothetical protein CONLIGDRAFT_712357 [Coniochaeta ligniaria NRRL 30616]
MALPISEIVQLHPSNRVKETGYTSQSSKAWLKHHPEITKFNLHTFEQTDSSGVQAVQADFDGPLEPLDADDEMRIATTVYPPNAREWRISSETDAANWFHHEISNVVLPAFSHYPTVQRQSL